MKTDEEKGECPRMRAEGLSLKGSSVQHTSALRKTLAYERIQAAYIVVLFFFFYAFTVFKPAALRSTPRSGGTADQ